LGQHSTSHQSKQRIIVESTAAAPSQLGGGCSKSGHGFGRDVEAKRVALDCSSWRLVRKLAFVSPADSGFELSHGLAISGKLEPRLLGVSGGHSCQLSHGRPAQLSLSKRIAQLG